MTKHIHGLCEACQCNEHQSCNAAYTELFIIGWSFKIESEVKGRREEKDCEFKSFSLTKIKILTTYICR